MKSLAQALTDRGFKPIRTMAARGFARIEVRGKKVSMTDVTGDK
jgi:hypothetical protein